MLTKILLSTFLISSMLGVSAHAELKLSSSSISSKKQIDNKFVANGFGCSGQNISPELHWSGAPKDTKYYAITLYDQDAPTGSGWWHWLIINIPVNSFTIPEGASSKESTLPTGAIQTKNDGGQYGYFGPCPPRGDKTHHYTLRLVALKDKIPLTKDVSGAMVGFYINSLKLEEAILRFNFER